MIARKEQRIRRSDLVTMNNTNWIDEMKEKCLVIRDFFLFWPDDFFWAAAFCFKFKSFNIENGSIDVSGRCTRGSNCVQDQRILGREIQKVEINSMAAICAIHFSDLNKLFDSEDPSTTFDWFKTYSDLKPLLQQAIPDKNASILILGCGNSSK